jgi:hypothetical protein
VSVVARWLAWLIVPLALLGCDKNGGGGNPAGPTDPAESAFLLQHNARFNSGRTVRWPNMPIRVFLNGIGTEEEVTEWTRATGGRVTFTFVGSRAGADIFFGFTTGDSICGVTSVEYTEDGVITSADVRLVEAIYRGPQCVRTVVHEIAHAIGFLDHTGDDGLMDPDGGNGAITDPVSRMMTNLYSLEPGTFIGAARAPRAELRSGGRRVITIVDPVRR